MNKKLAKLQKLRDTIYKLRDTLDYYQRLFKEDGQVSTGEEKTLEKMKVAITKIEEEIKKREDKLGFFENIFDSSIAAKDASEKGLHKTKDAVTGTEHDDHITKPINIIKLDYQVDFIPHKLTFYNNGKAVSQQDVSPAGKQPQQISFSLPIKGSTLKDNSISFKISGIDHATLKAKESPLAIFDIIKLSGLTKSFTSTTPLLCSVYLSWLGDGEKEFPIMINGLASKEDAKEPYWDPVKKEIQDETGSTFSKDDSLFLDGDANGDMISKNFGDEHRRKQGIQAAIKNAAGLFSKLDKNEKGKIIQRIQVYSHSRGSTYANGFIEQLKKEIAKKKELFDNPSNVIDVVIHLDAHQSDTIKVKPGNHPTILVSHDGSFLGGSDAEGDAFNIERNEHFIGTPLDHKLSSFNDDLKGVLDQHNVNDLLKIDDKYNDFETALGNTDKAKHAPAIKLTEEDKVIKLKYNSNLLPKKITIYNNDKVIHEEEVDYMSKQSQDISFSFSLNDSILKNSIISCKIVGINFQTKQREHTSSIPLDVLNSSYFGENYTSQKPLPCLLSLYWLGDGEKEFPIMINGLATEDDAKEPYWDPLREKIQNETGSTFSKDDSLFLDGDADGDKLSDNLFSDHRYKQGIEAAKLNAEGLFSKLEKNVEGKIIQRIQIYSHSRGSAYANGFIEQLEKEIAKKKELFANPSNVIDIVIHLDAHQSGSIKVKPGNHPTILVSHDGSALGSSNAQGDAFTIERNESWVGTPLDHKLDTFDDDLEDVLKQHNSNTSHRVKDKYTGFDKALGNIDKAEHAEEIEED